MIAIAERTGLVTSVRFSGSLVPETQSGRALLVSMTDEEVRALEPGDIILWQGYGQAIRAPLVPVVVLNVREGIAWGNGDREPYEVPVVEGMRYNLSVPVSVAAPDCLYFIETDVRVPKVEELSARNFANWAERKGHAVKEIVTAAYEP